MSSNPGKRRRTSATDATDAVTASVTPSPRDASLLQSSGAPALPPITSSSTPTRSTPGAPDRAPPPTLTGGLGQVIASASKYVRVELYSLLSDEAPTPLDWRPLHMRPRPQLDGGAADESGPGPSASVATAGTEPGSRWVTTLSADGRPDDPAGHAEAAGLNNYGVGSAASAAGSEAAAVAGGDDSSRDSLVPAGEPRPVVLCSVRALLRKLRTDVVVGDVVRVGSVDWVHGTGVVSEVLPRTSRLVDPNVANVDHLLLVFALDQPPFEELQVSRFLVAAEAAALPATLVLNKSDLVGPEVLARRLAQCRLWGYEPVVLSCERGEGVEQVASVLQDRITAVAGPSGAGKSSLINCLRLGRHRPDLTDDRRATEPDQDDLLRLPPDIARQYGGSTSLSSTDSELAEAAGGSGCDEDDERSCGEVAGARGGTGAASGGHEGGGSAVPSPTGDEPPPEFLAVGGLSKIGRGMHTTTAIRLLRLLGGGWLADTPGFGQPALDGVSSQQLASCFPEMVSLVSEQPCRFSDCLHVAEPGCSVRGAGLERYTHYLRFLQEIRTRETGDMRQVQRAKAEREGYAKTKSARGGGERLEARLDSKKHRRASRQSTKLTGSMGELE